MRDELRRMALFTSGVAELTRHRAEEMVKQWVGSGDVRRDQAASLVKNMLEVSRSSRRELLRLVRAEVQRQIESLGVASARDVQRLERRVARLETDRKKTAAKKTTAKKTPRKTSRAAERRV